MSEELTNDCVAPETFPRRPNNRPALPHVGYRIGEYGDIRDFLLRRINLAPELKAWTHRGADDPGIALLEGAAVVGDILTFYQEHYANEAYLRTAQWHESIANLVRLLGYRLSPGLSGSGKFAFEVKGSDTVTIPASYPLKAELDEVSDAVEFETSAELIAYPHLSRFSLYRRRVYTPVVLPANATSFEIASAGGATDAASLEAAGLKAGEKLLLMSNEASWVTTGNTFTTAQLAKIKAVTLTLGRCIVETEGALQPLGDSTISAYRIGRTFRHFGHAAPAKIHTSVTGTIPGSSPAATGVIGMIESATSYVRHLHGTCKHTDGMFDPPADFMPLDQEVTDLTPGTTLIFQAPVGYDTDEYNLTAARTIKTVTQGPYSYGDLQGASTYITLDERIAPKVDDVKPTTDIREIRLHEATSPVLIVRRVSNPPAGTLTAVNQLSFYGTAEEAAVLENRTLLFQADDGRTAEATVQQITAVADLADGDEGMRPLVLSTVLNDFAHEDFDETEPTVAVFGNVVEATQGKSQAEVVLGSGDNRETFQTFKLPKAPLAYFNSSSATPPEVPELTVYVEEREWTRVDSFFGHEAMEEIYLVRQDSKGDSYIQFGDGLTGARLPSGLKNVTAIYRVGSGAHGSLKIDTKVSPGSRIVHLEKIQLPGVIAGGSEAETGEKARAAAPAKLQSLGRIVSISDYEAETLTLAGVTKAAASWEQVFGLPAVVLTVLLEAGRADEYASVKASILAAQRDRGPDRHSVVVRQAFLRYVYLDVDYAFDSTYQQEDVEAALRLALGFADTDDDETVAAKGLFALDARKLGEAEYATRIEGALQNVAGILWCKVTALGLLGSPATAVDDPTELTLPAEPKPLATYTACLPNELLQLDLSHLSLSAVSP